MSFWYRSDVCSSNRRANRQKKSYARQGAGALAILCTLGAVVRAQDVPPGFVARFDVTQRFEYSDNPDFDEDGSSDFFGRTILGFGLESVTKVQRFALDLGTDIEEGREDQSSVDVTNSFANLSYDRNTRNALIGLDLSYRESDTDSDFFDDDFDLDGNVINQDSGTRETYRYGLEWAVGREAPIGASVNLNYSEINYSDTTDPDRTDQSDTDIRGQVDFRITPLITTNLTGRYSDFDAQGNGTNRETTGFGAGVVLDISRIYSADVSLSYDRIERTGDETGTDEGISIDTGLTRAMPNGSIGLRFRSDLETNDNGRRSFLSVEREMELPRGALSYSIGLTGAGDIIGTDPLLSLDYTESLRTGSLSIGLAQNVNTDNDNNEEINTTFSVGYDQPINRLSGFGVNFAFRDRNELGDTPNDGQRIDLSLSYRHDLTRDWGLVSGISHASSTEDNDDDRRRTTIFVGVQRSFNWTP